MKTDRMPRGEDREFVLSGGRSEMFSSDARGANGREQAEGPT